MHVRIWMAVVVATAAMAAVGCDSGGGKASKDKAADSDDDAKDDDGDDSKSKKKKKSKKKAAADEDTGDTEVAAAGPACEGPNVIPSIPATRSKPPTLDEWGTACDVNTQGANSQAADCTMKVKREWLQITCRGNMTGYEQFDGFGTVGQDYFEQHRAGQMASFVVRLRKGRSMKVRMCRGTERASMFVSWPPAAAKPTIIALATGPACDGSGWGAHN